MNHSHHHTSHQKSATTSKSADNQHHTAAAQAPNAASDDPHAEIFSKLHPWAKHILKYAGMLVDFPNYLSIHAGGILVSEEPLSQHTALQMMPKGFPITHFDMYAAEDWGYHKFDVLSQRGLGHIKETVDLVKRNQDKSIEIHDIEAIKADKNVRTQLKSGKCIGCFYIESPAMRGLLSKLRCEEYVHLVAASSIIRPGVARSGMMREYIQRFHQPNGFEYIHPTFKEYLGETFGVMVYQEDVMKILHHFADISLDEADVMRRMMTGKKRSSADFARLQQKYFDNCKAKGHSDELAAEVWRQIESFSGYSFCKAHSASFAVESYQSLYLKTYFPVEFMVAVINNFGGFYHTEYYVHEARMSGGTVHAPCVNRSEYKTSLTGTDIWLGFVHLQGLEQQVAMAIVEQRRLHGPYKGLEDLVQRVAISPSQLVILIRIGALRFTGLSKCQLLWERNRVMRPDVKANVGMASLFESFDNEQFTLPKLDESDTPQALEEMELLGFPLCSPFELLRDSDKATMQLATQAFLQQSIGKPITVLGYYVCRKHTTTIKGELMNFGTWIDREGHFFDTVHFPDALKQHNFTGKGVYRISGKVVSDFGFLSIEVREMERLPFYI